MAKAQLILADIDSFGAVAAEDDPILDFFLATSTHERIATGDALLVLGRKGSGKTALVRYFSERDDTDAISRALSFKAYPWQATP